MFRPLMNRLQLTVVILLMAHPAAAGSDNDTLRQFGRFGKWGDCSKSTYMAFEDKLGDQPEYYLMHAGKLVGRRHTITKVQLVSVDTLSYDLTRAGTMTASVTLKKSGNTINLHEVKDPQYGTTIRDGKNVPTGTPSDRMRKCG